MGATYDDKEVHDEMHTSPKGWTTIVLNEIEERCWLATQVGVAVQGHGETAAEAAAEYCRKVSEMG